MAGREISRSIGTAPAAAPPFPWEAIHEINERALELLVQIARSAANPLTLPPTLRDLLRQTSPEDRKRAAARPYILVDLEFRNIVWWEAVRRSPERQFPGNAGLDPLPKRAAVPLARTLLMAAREAIRADPEIAVLILGIDPQVAALVSGLQIADIDRLAAHQFRRMAPRWLDHSRLWRSLLLSAESPERTEVAQFDAHCLQLQAGNLLSNVDDARASTRRHPIIGLRQDSTSGGCHPSGHDRAK